MIVLPCYRSTCDDICESKMIAGEQPCLLVCLSHELIYYSACIYTLRLPFAWPVPRLFWLLLLIILSYHLPPTRSSKHIVRLIFSLLQVFKELSSATPSLLETAQKHLVIDLEILYCFFVSSQMLKQGRANGENSRL